MMMDRQAFCWESMDCVQVGVSRHRRNGAQSAPSWHDCLPLGTPCLSQWLSGVTAGNVSISPANRDAKTVCQFRGGSVVQFCMTKPFSVRARPSLIEAIDARAARLGQDRTKYILTLVERDLIEEKKPRQHKFASHDLIGAFCTRTGPATNENTRRIVARRIKERREKTR
jgi:hypothetical protein